MLRLALLSRTAGNQCQASCRLRSQGARQAAVTGRHRENICTARESIAAGAAATATAAVTAAARLSQLAQKLDQLSRAKLLPQATHPAEDARIHGLGQRVDGVSGLLPVERLHNQLVQRADLDGCVPCGWRLRFAMNVMCTLACLARTTVSCIGGSIIHARRHAAAAPQPPHHNHTRTLTHPRQTHTPSCASAHAPAGRH